MFGKKKKFSGIEFGILYGNKVKVVRVPCDKFESIIFNKETNMATCTDAIGSFIYGVPMDSLVYAKRIVNGDWER